MKIEIVQKVNLKRKSYATDNSKISFKGKTEIHKKTGTRAKIKKLQSKT